MAIAAAAAALTSCTEQSLTQEVGSGDEGLGLFRFDLSSAETGPWWLEGEEEQEKEEKEKPKQTRRAYPRPDYMPSTWRQWLQKLQELSAAPDELDPACREA